MFAKHRCVISPDLSEIRYRFTSCNASGRVGPVPPPCNSQYGNTPISRDDVSLRYGSINYDRAQGFQSPHDANYRITVVGAAGGRGLCNIGSGRGLIVTQDRYISEGSQFLVLVGQRGLGPCSAGVDPDYPLCQDPPTTIEESANCTREWLTESSGLHFRQFVGGGGGGGASMVWSVFPNQTINDLEFFPLIVAGGGGGSSRDFDLDFYSSVLHFTTVDCCNKSASACYQLLQDAKPQHYDPFLHDDWTVGKRGFTWLSSTSGVGGGFLVQSDGEDEDGEQIGDKEAFAKGGFDCLRAESDGDETILFEGANGGFGGGGGGCVMGGGGGGFTGGELLVYGREEISPGGGGYSTIGGTSGIPEGNYSWNAGDGYVEFLPLDCGCVHACVIHEEEEEFECTCPAKKNAQLAPDESDCFTGTVV